MTRAFIALPAEPDPEFLTVREFFVDVLRLSEKSGYRIMKSDPTFPVLTVGGTKRIPAKEARAWLARRTQGGLE